MWLPVHGCALPLPRRSPQRCGVRQFGPKPSPLWVKCSDDPQLAWILLVGGPEAIAELAPGTVLRGLMRRIDRAKKVVSHDEPQDKS